MALESENPGFEGRIWQVLEGMTLGKLQTLREIQLPLLKIRKKSDPPPRGVLLGSWI